MTSLLALRGVRIDTMKVEIPGHPGYSVDDQGNIYGKRGNRLRTFSGTGGYLRFTTYHDGAWQQVSVHVMACLAFHGPRPDGTHAAHRNGNHQDNRAENLRWATAKQNELDKISHGTKIWGERHHQHKLTADEVKEIRSRQTLLREEAHRYGVTISCISRVRKGQTWRHIK